MIQVLSNQRYRVLTIHLDQDRQNKTQSVMNAFAIPGGYVFVLRKLIEEVGSEAELAGVLGHEWAHVVAHHSKRNIWPLALVNAASFSSIAGISILQKLGKLRLELPQLILLNVSLALFPNLFLTSFSRHHEAEADLLGVQYAANAGFAPWGIGKVFHRFEKMMKDLGITPTGYLDSHPLNMDRVAAITTYASLFYPERDTYVESSEEFKNIQNLLSEMPRPSEADSILIEQKVKTYLKGKGVL